MAKPKLDLPPLPTLLGCIDDQGRLAVLVTPGSRTEAMSVDAGQVQIKVRAKPQGGAANDAVLALLAKALQVAPSRLTLLRGATSREKLFQLSS